MKSIKTGMLVALTVSTIATATAHKSNAETHTNGRSIVDAWKSIYLRLDLGKSKYANKMQGVGKRPMVNNMIGFGIGYKFPWHNFRGELNMQKSEFKVSSTSQQLRDRTRAYMLNLYKDFTLPQAGLVSKLIVPYVTAGIGTAKFNTSHVSQPSASPTKLELRSEKNFLWNIGAGIQIKVDKAFSIDFCYRHLDLGAILTLSTLKKSKMNNNQGIISVIWHFW